MDRVVHTAQQCKKHKKKAEHIIINQNNEVEVACSRCVLVQEKSKLILLIEDVVSCGDSDYIFNWPPLSKSDRNTIFEELENVEKNKQYDINKFESTCTSIKEDIKNAVDALSKKMINSYQQQCEAVLQNYNQISQKDELKDSILPQGQQDYSSFFALYKSQMEKQDTNRSLLTHYLSKVNNNFKFQKEYLELCFTRFKAELSLFDHFISISNTDEITFEQMEEQIGEIIDIGNNIKEIGLNSSCLIFQQSKFSLEKMTEKLIRENSDRIEDLKALQEYVVQSIRKDKFQINLKAQIMSQSSLISESIKNSFCVFTKTKDNYNYDFGVVNCKTNVRYELNEFRIRISKLNGQIFVGVANPSDFPYKLLTIESMDKIKQKGLSLLSSKGYSWFTKSDQEDGHEEGYQNNQGQILPFFNKRIEFNFKENDIIKVEYNSKGIKFTNETQETTCEFPQRIDQQQVPAFILTDEGDQITFLFPDDS